MCIIGKEEEAPVDKPLGITPRNFFSKFYTQFVCILVKNA